MERVKVKLFQQHFANVDKDFLYQFHHLTGIINIVSFIKEECYVQFGIFLESSRDMKEFERVLNEYYYKDKSEWLREKMRHAMIDCK